MIKPTLQVIYQQLTRLQEEVQSIKKMVIEEPVMRSEAITRIQDIASEKSIKVKNFRKRYGVA